MRIELIYFIEILLGSILFYIEIGFLNKIISLKGKSTLSIKKDIGNLIGYLISPRRYYLEAFVLLFIALTSSYLLNMDGKIHQVLLLFAIADLIINQRFTSLAHLSNTLLICVFIGLNGYAPIGLLIVQLVFFILYSINKGKGLRVISIVSQLTFFLSCLSSFNLSVKELLIAKFSIVFIFPFFYLIILHFIRSTPTLKPLKLDNIMWIIVMLGSLRGFL